MKKLVPVFLLFLSGCGASEDEGANQTIALEDELLANLSNASTAEDSARVQELVDRAMGAALRDADKAQYRNVRAGVGGSACGEVALPERNGKPGAYRHFVITPDAVAVIGTGPGVKFNDPSDSLADAWIRWCASNEELKLVESQLEPAPALVPEPLPGADLPTLPEEPLPSLPRQAEPRRSASSPPPPAQIDSFSKSVSRPQ